MQYQSMRLSLAAFLWLHPSVVAASLCAGGSCAGTRGSLLLATRNKLSQRSSPEAVQEEKGMIDADPQAPVKAEGASLVILNATRNSLHSSSCPCENPSYPCRVARSCWSYSTKASCESAGGSYCERPASCIENCQLCASETACSVCKAGYMALSGHCTLVPTGGDPHTWMKVHNLYRCMHGVPSVSWSFAAAASAQRWVDSWCNDFSCMVHSDSYNEAPPAGPAGENLAMGYSSILQATSTWYEEVSSCNALPGCQSGSGVVGHFTAMIWKGVSEIGCASNANSRRGYACRYRSGDTMSCNTANMAGCYEQMVLPRVKSLAACILEFDGSSTATITTTKLSSTTSMTTKSATMPATTTMTSTSSSMTASMPAGVSFWPVDGGMHRYCRGDTPTDNKSSYYLLKQYVTSLQACQNLCREMSQCTGVEYQFSRQRCELWNRPIRASLWTASYSTCLTARRA
eukprot:TRINITY_DN6386_c0_g1_i1.p1 TRINITY_DN6386_c0_g1~~TRINITY_DN6386_c0_g1_i1.p1  ORF type:complete len:460 (-),score=52.35 TRINITY_DN6386_c0_g1_i1:101-1480(-)